MEDTMFKLGRNLVSQNVIPFDVLEKAMKRKQQEDRASRRNLAQILVNEFEVDEDQVYEEVARHMGVATIDLAKEPVDERRLRFMQKMTERLSPTVRKLCQNEHILIYDYIKLPTPRFIFLAVDVSNANIPVIARAIGARRHEVRHVRLAEFKELSEQIFKPANEFLKNLAETEMDISDDSQGNGAMESEALESEINKSYLVNLVEGMLVEAVRRKASDIHIIPKGAANTEIHLRIDGRLQPWYSDRPIRPEALTAVIKDRTKNIDRFERESAQDGFIQRSIDGHMIRYRVSVMPVVGQDFQNKLESIVIRVLDDRNVITDFEKLGFQEQARQAFLKAITRPQGLVIVTGPTGSGKSTTLIASLSYLINPEINILTVEDPVEYLIPGVRQIKIGPKNDFERALRSILRHDPDVVMVGEIRDRETAEIAIKMANTGHLTFSTLHTNDAPSAISRLYKMGIETFLLAYAINIIIAQRLIRQLCDHCKKAVEDLDPALPKSLGFSDAEIADTTFYEAVGCSKCNNGYKGRVAIHEALFMTKEIRGLIFNAGRDIDEDAIRRQAIADGMLTLRASARARVRAGITTLREIALATTED